MAATVRLADQLHGRRHGHRRDSIQAAQQGLCAAAVRALAYWSRQLWLGVQPNSAFILAQSKAERGSW
jgi:hypothetical protein